VSNQYLYGELLVKASEKFEESVLVFLEMLKIFFPEGSKFDENWIPMSHFDLFKNIDSSLVTGFEGSAEDQTSCNLLTRVFSLFPFNQQPDMSLNRDNIDMDLSVFMTYAHTLKSQMHFVFETILYKLFRSDRAEADTKTF